MFINRKTLRTARQFSRQSQIEETGESYTPGASGVGDKAGRTTRPMSARVHRSTASCRPGIPVYLPRRRATAPPSLLKDYWVPDLLAPINNSDKDTDKNPEMPPVLRTRPRKRKQHVMNIPELARYILSDICKSVCMFFGAGESIFLIVSFSTSGD